MQTTKLLLGLLLLAATQDSFGQCGTERWPVKTMTDPWKNLIVFTPVKSTVEEQVAMTRSQVYHDVNPRDDSEKKVYVIDCILVKYKVETDRDWHLVVKDLHTNKTMVVEIPDPTCSEITDHHLSHLKTVRNKFLKKLPAPTSSFQNAPAGMKIRVTGVGFWDKPNHPVGFTGREIHPVFNMDFVP